LDSLQKNKTIALLGYGELAKQLLSHLEISINDITIFDDLIEEKNLDIFHFKEYNSKIKQYQWLIALGYKHLRKKKQIIDEICAKSSLTPYFVHPSSFISKSSTLKSGVFVYPMCNIDQEVHIAEGTVINNSVIISHNSIVGKANYISPGVVISGNVKIGNSCFIGSGCIIANEVKIGDNVVIGAGTFISENIPSNSKVIGNPMTFKSNLNIF
tara:strand:- start:99 stop:737 length:639 start_codon:yes stop_codon:yes gene_type:complete